MSKGPARNKSKSTTVTLTHDQYADLKRLAEQRLSSVSQVVRSAVRDLVERERRAEVRDAR